jgi:hypothetical protein
MLSYYKVRIPVESLIVGVFVCHDAELDQSAPLLFCVWKDAIQMSVVTPAIPKENSCDFPHFIVQLNDVVVPLGDHDHFLLAPSKFTEGNPSLS